MTFIKRIAKRLKSPQGIKISLSILLISIFFFAPTFAQSANTGEEETLKNLHLFLEKLTGILSWIWVLLASLAGKFMTNDMIYGSWLNLDAYLWKLRNICKNFANFGLLAFLLRGIISFIKNKGESIQKLITQTLIAGVLIQASWFLFAAVIDVSTILTASVATFPSNFIDKNAIQENVVLKEAGKNMHASYIKIDQNGGISEIEKGKDLKPFSEFNEKEFLEKIMPKDDSISGPLVYIGATTLKIQDAINKKVEGDPTAKKVLTTSLLQFLMIGLYCITLILLIIANVIRVALLWMIIPLSPIIILMIVMGKSKSMEGKGILKNFNIGVILHAIFKPVLFTAVMSMILIFVVSMQTMMGGNSETVDIQGTTIGISDGKAVMENQGISSITINDSLFKEVGSVSKNIFSGLIIYFATIFMLRYMVKIAAKSGGGTIGETMDKATGTIEKMASTAPIFAGYSAAALQKGGNQALEKFGKASGINLNFSGGNAGKLDSDKRLRRFLDEKLGIVTRYDSDYEKLIDSDDFIGTTKSMIGGLNQNSFPKREKILNEKIKEKKKIGIEEIDGKKNNYFKEGNEKSIKTLNTEGFKLLHEKLGGKLGDEPKNYDGFLKLIRENYYHPKKD
ncbi:MAG: hypothetical protein PHR61_03305 [Candidatus Absconditabacteria bacterium]|nr:hypothetical protein [Candidatus Absconditabacteria bacterium]